MLLNKLSTNEKEAFVSLVVKAAEANDEITIEEYNLVEEYCKEMGIIFFDSKKLLSMDKVIEVIKSSTGEIKRIISLELIGMLYVDGEFDQKESDFLYSFVDAIGIERDVIEEQIYLINKYMELLNDIKQNVEG